MERKLSDALMTIRVDISLPARALSDACEELADGAATFGLDDYMDNMHRVTFAAKELVRRIDSLLDPRHEAFQGDAPDLHAAGRKIRHDLRNAVGAVMGYLEIVEEDLRESGNAPDAQGISSLKAQVADLDRLIGATVYLAGETPTHEPAAAALPQFDDEDFRSQPDDDPDRLMIKGKILVVDDDKSSRNLLVTRLERDGHVVKQSPDGETALDMMREEEFDVVLLDLMMPGMNGFEVMAKMRKSSILRRVGIIVISGLDQEENAIKSISLGAEDYLPKPINSVLLRARIGSTLARKRWRDEERVYRMHLESERSKSEALLLNTLPAFVVQRLSAGEKAIADAYDEVTVLFSDFAGFTDFASKHDAKQVVEVLNRVFTDFDDLALDLGVEKIKTIGDGYLAVAGLPVQRPDHADIAADLALGMLDNLKSINQRFGIDLKMRIGLNSGPVVAGIIGSHKFAYDVWGHTVNSAARHESYSLPQHIHISSSTAALLSDRFHVTGRGEMSLRGIGEVNTYFLTGSKTDFGAPAGSGALPTGTAEKFSVLIVDDDVNLQELMARRIRRHGWEAEVLTNGAEAWTRLQDRSFDLLITDCEMPIMDGYELTKLIRKAEKVSGEYMPIIAVTGNDTRECAQHCLNAGMSAFLRKPVMWVELERIIRRLRAEKYLPYDINASA